MSFESSVIGPIIGAPSRAAKVTNSTLGTIIAALIRTKKYTRAAKLQPMGQYQVPIYTYDGLVIPMTARISEVYQFQSDMTEHPVEDGSFVSDHVVLHPVRLDLSFEVGNFDGLGMDADTAAKALDIAIGVWSNRQPFDLLTTHRYLKNMVCVGLIPENSAPEWGTLRFRASFKQANMGQLQTIQYNPSNVMGGGLATTETAPDANLARITPDGPANGLSAASASPRITGTPTIAEGRNGKMFTTH